MILRSKKSICRRFEVEISDFATRCRSGRGFWQGDGGQKGGCSGRTAECRLQAPANVGCKPQHKGHGNFTALFAPFGASPRDRRGVPVLCSFRRGRAGARGRSPPSRSGCVGCRSIFCKILFLFPDFHRQAAFSVWFAVRVPVATRRRSGPTSL